MKIIGDADASMFVVIASRDELANVAGFHSAYASEMDGKIKVGATIKVGDMYNKVRAIAGAEHQLVSAQRTLRAVADLLDPIVPAIEGAHVTAQEPQA